MQKESIYDLEKITPTNFDYSNQLKDYVYNLTLSALHKGDAEREEINTLEQMEERKRQVRALFMNSLGEMPEKTPLHPEITETIQYDGYRVEKIIFESMPKHYVTANAYIPDGTTAPVPAVLFLCGHAPESKNCEKYQEVCQRLVRRGMFVLAQDPLGQGERAGYYDPHTNAHKVKPGTTEHDYVGTQCIPMGFSLSKLFLFESMRSVDYMLTRPEVDGAKIAVTGNSGGGLQTLFMMLGDDRIAAAAPATYLCDRETIMYSGLTQDAEQIQMNISKDGFDHIDYLVGFAPKPTMVLAVKYDFFPIEGTRKTFENAKKYWEMAGKANMLQMTEDAWEHKYTPKLAEACADFLCEAFNIVKAPIEMEVGGKDPESMLCCKTGKIIAEKEDAEFAFHYNQTHRARLREKRNAIPEEKRMAMSLAMLKEKIFANRVPVPANIRFQKTGQINGLRYQHCYWFSQKGIINSALLFTPAEGLASPYPLTIMAYEHGSSQLEDKMPILQQECGRKRAVLVLNVSATGAIKPFPFYYGRYRGTIQKLAADLFWIGDSIPAIRAYDIIRAVQAFTDLPDFSTEDVKLISGGNFAVYSILAAFVDPNIQQLELTSPVWTYESFISERIYNMETPIELVFPGMLEFCDLDELVKWRA